MRRYRPAVKLEEFGFGFIYSSCIVAHPSLTPKSGWRRVGGNPATTHLEGNCGKLSFIVISDLKQGRWRASLRPSPCAFLCRRSSTPALCLADSCRGSTAGAAWILKLPGPRACRISPSPRRGTFPLEIAGLDVPQADAATRILACVVREQPSAVVPPQGPTARV